MQRPKSSRNNFFFLDFFFLIGIIINENKYINQSTNDSGRVGALSQSPIEWMQKKESNGRG